MPEKEIKEFITKSLNEIKESLPEGFIPDGKFDFEISVIVTKENEGKIGIKLIEGGFSNAAQQVHKIRFSVIHTESQKRNIQFAAGFLSKLANDLNKFEKVKSLPIQRRGKQ